MPIIMPDGTDTPTPEDAAWAEISRLTSAPGGPGASWRWSIPARPDRDSDLILAAGLQYLRDQLDAVRSLHHKVTRYSIEVTEEYTSYATLAEARETWDEYYLPVLADDPEAPEFRYDEFDLCAECSENVRREMDTNGVEEWGYSEQWPCRTAQALGKTV